jgi:hypothetical protein
LASLHPYTEFVEDVLLERELLNEFLDASLPPKTHAPADDHDAPTKRVRELFGDDLNKDFTNDCDFIDSIAKIAKTIAHTRSILQSDEAQAIL